MEKKFNINIGAYKKEEESPIIKINKPTYPKKIKNILSGPSPLDLNITEEEEKVEPINEGITEIKGRCIVTGIETYHWTKKDGVIKDIVEEHEIYKASIIEKHPEAKDFREAYKLEQEAQ